MLKEKSFHLFLHDLKKKQKHVNTATDRIYKSCNGSQLLEKKDLYCTEISTTSKIKSSHRGNIKTAAFIQVSKDGKKDEYRLITKKKENKIMIIMIILYQTHQNIFACTY